MFWWSVSRNKRAETLWPAYICRDTPQCAPWVNWRGRRCRSSWRPGRSGIWEGRRASHLYSAALGWTAVSSNRTWPSCATGYPRTSGNHEPLQDATLVDQPRDATEAKSHTIRQMIDMCSPRAFWRAVLISQRPQHGQSQAMQAVYNDPCKNCIRQEHLAHGGAVSSIGSDWWTRCGVVGSQVDDCATCLCPIQDSPKPSWKAQCGETRLLRLERGKGREALPIATSQHERRKL